jgi:tRNA threonylcarbamoyl adenosine modification protein (Sua5/YciO/YrdC/YwlC family)
VSQFFTIHPDNPQQRLIRQAVEIIRKGGVVIYPTDSGYAIGCHIGDKRALERICDIRRVDDKHNFTLLCRDLSEIASYAQIDNEAFRLLKANTPGAYTFIFKASKEVPRRLQHEKKKTIGIRVPDNAIARALLEELAEPMMTSSLILPDSEFPLSDPYDIRERLEKRVDLIIDGDIVAQVPTTVVDMSGDVPVIIRYGQGNPLPFE